MHASMQVQVPAHVSAFAAMSLQQAESSGSSGQGSLGSQLSSSQSGATSLQPSCNNVRTDPCMLNLMQS